MYIEEEDAIDGDSAAARYQQRTEKFRARFGDAGPALHRLAWLVHNCVAHPAIGLAPSLMTRALHDRTADVLNLAERPSTSRLPTLRRPLRWVLHNCVAHPLMGLAPHSALFAWHDHSADEMDEPDWV